MAARRDRANEDLYLAAFGKHPAWDDHIEDLGIDTDLLVRTKRDLYIKGIGGNLDAGSWEALPEDRRLPGFGHVFSWVLDGRLVAGRMWASRDGKGRARYPMIAAAECRRGQLPWLLGTLLPCFESIEQQCRQAVTPEDVKAAFAGARAGLRTQADPSGGRDAVLPCWIASCAALSGFLDSLDAAAGGQPVLPRVLHRIRQGFAPAARRRAASVPGLVAAHHLRLPAGGEDRLRSLVFWTAILRAIAGPAVPVLLLRPLEQEWVDAILGRPDVSHLYCLLASREALPLTSEIPFNVGDEVQAEADGLLRGWRGGEGDVRPLITVGAPSARSWLQRLQARVGRGWTGRPRTEAL